VISHDLAVVKYLSDRIGVMYLGKLVELGTGDDIYKRAAHPYTDALIKTIPVPDPAVKRADIAISGELPSPPEPSIRLPLQDTLPAGPGPLRRGGAAAALVRFWPWAACTSAAGNGRAGRGGCRRRRSGVSHWPPLRLRDLLRSGRMRFHGSALFAWQRCCARVACPFAGPLCEDR